MSDLDNFFKMHSELISQQLKISQSLQPVIAASLNINAMLSKSLEPIRLTLESISLNAQLINQQYYDIFNKLPTLDISCYVPIQNILSNLEHINNFYQNAIDTPELSFRHIADSFNQFIDSSEIDVTGENINTDLNDIKNVINNGSSLKWNEWVTLIIAILGLLISIASYAKPTDNSYQEKQLRLLEDISSSCHEISSDK